MFAPQQFFAPSQNAMPLGYMVPPQQHFPVSPVPLATPQPIPVPPRQQKAAVPQPAYKAPAAVKQPAVPTKVPTERAPVVEPPVEARASSSAAPVSSKAPDATVVETNKASITGAVSNSFVPRGAEMLQVTVFGVKDIEGIKKPTVKVEVPGKHTFQIETTVLDDHPLNPKSTITFVTPEDDLVFSVLQGEECFGEASVSSDDFFPKGFEGDLVIGTSNETIAMKLSVLANGEIEQLAPVTVKSTCPVLETLPVEGAAVAAGVSAPRLCSPEEYQWACNQPGAVAPLMLTEDEFAKLNKGVAS